MLRRKRTSPWLTRHQLEVLDSIAQHGWRGVPLWYTGISLSTIRSLAKRGYVDTRARGRIIATRAGKRRLKQPWPIEQPTGDQKDRAGSGAAVVPIVQSEGAAAVSSRDSLTESGE